MRNDNKKIVISSKTLLKVKTLIKEAKKKRLVKSHTVAFTKNPVEYESHKGELNYFYD